MCLYTDYKTPITAIEPMRVWKRLLRTDNGFETPFRHTEAKVGEILKGLFPDKELRESINLRKYVVDEQGVHAYITQYKAKENKCGDEVITEWEIPAGAKYWIGTGYSGAEIAATEMMFIKVCED